VQYAVKSEVFIPGATEPSDPFKVRTAKISATNEKQDVALLDAEFPPAAHGIAEVAPAPKNGMFAQHSGHMFGLWWSYTAGYVSAMRMMDGITVIQATTPILPGSSGGGLFDDKGRLLGIASRGKNPLNFFIPASEVAELLK
jgi:S1-C subfamily serine protease